MSDVVERTMFRRRLNSTPAWIGHRAPDCGLTEVDPEQAFRYDPAYFTYYYSLKPLDPRLAPPLFKSHFPNYEQPEVSGEYPDCLEVPPYRPKEVDYVYTSVPIVDQHDVHELGAYVPHVAESQDAENELEPNPVLSEMCEDVKTDSSGVIGAGLLGFHLSHALRTEENRREIMDESEQTCMGTEEYADEDLDTQSCPTTEALSLVSESSSSSSKKKRSDKITRIPQRILPLVPSMEAGRVPWLLAPIPEACGTVQCSIWRDKKLLNSRYILNLEMPPTPNVVADSFGREFLDGNVQKATQQFMCAGKRIGRGVYLLSADKDDFDKKSQNYIAKCRRNITNHDFTILAARDAKKKKDKRGTTKRELAAVDFAPSSKNTPAHVQAVLPDTSAESSDEWLLNQFNNGRSVNDSILKNTQPMWNKKSKSYEIDFGGRVKMPSVKNMQLQNIAVDKTPVTLTFGKVEENHFVLDFAYPLSVVQAFGIALAAFDAL